MDVLICATHQRTKAGELNSRTNTKQIPFFLISLQNHVYKRDSLPHFPPNSAALQILQRTTPAGLSIFIKLFWPFCGSLQGVPRRITYWKVGHDDISKAFREVILCSILRSKWEHNPLINNLSIGSTIPCTNSRGGDCGQNRLQIPPESCPLSASCRHVLLVFKTTVFVHSGIESARRNDVINSENRDLSVALIEAIFEC